MEASLARTLLAQLRQMPSACAAAILLVLPTSTLAQDATYLQGRLDGLQRELAGLSAKIEQLKAQDQQLQQRLESMRTKFEAHLERMEKGGTAAKGKRRQGRKSAR